MSWLQFETNTDCNARCSFCPRTFGLVKRPPMSGELLDIVINEWVPHFPTIMPFLYQEPALEPQLPEITCRIKHMNPGASIVIYTNMGAVDSDMAAQWVLGGNIDYIYISFYGPTQAIYRKYQPPLDWMKTQVNILNLMSIIRSNNLTKPKVTMWYLHTPELLQFEPQMRRQWERIVDEFGVVPYETFSGAVPDLDPVTTPLIERPVCSSALSGVNILSNGDVVPCCHDYSGSVVFGNIGESSYNEIMHGEKRLEFLHRMTMRQFDQLPDLCRDCTAWTRK